MKLDRRTWSLLVAIALALPVVAFASSEADAQTVYRTRKRVTKHKKTTKKRSHHRHRSRTTHRHHANCRHRASHRHHRTTRMHWRTPTHRRHYHRHRRHHRHTPQREVVIIVEQDDSFTPPELDCPIRTREKRNGMEQWCATVRGTRDGPYRRWYSDGTLAAEGAYRSGDRHGVWLEYHQNGQPRLEAEYDDGDREGVWYRWDSDGAIVSVIEY